MLKRGSAFGKSISLLLAVAMVFSCLAAAVSVPAVAKEESSVVSRLVEGENGVYIEYLGKPYLMYGMQMRLDWAYNDKSGDEAFIAENFERVVDDGFTSVAIPIYWSTVEPTKDAYDFSRLEMYYKYLDMYDLTVQWLWFGTNVCGSASLTPGYIRNDSQTYKKVFAPNAPGATYADFSCDATLEREKAALLKMMEWLSVNDTDKRCVMIQVNNEVDQGGNNFDPYYSPGLTAEEKKAYVGYRWYEYAPNHDAYCWAGGQREECFAYLSALGDIVHQSPYSVVTRVNFSGAGRNMPEIEDDLTDLLALGGIDIVGEDIYSTTWSEVTKTFNLVEGNLHHLAENGAGYDSSYVIAKSFALGGGVILHCHRDDRTENGGGGMYVNSQGEEASDENRSYREWVDCDAAPQIRSFAETIKAVYQPLANAVASRDFVEFNGEKADTCTATKAVGDISLTYSADNNGLGMAFKAGENKYIITATQNAEFTVSDKAPVSVESGSFDGETWVQNDEAVSVDGKTISVKAGQIILLDYNASYEFFGEEKEITVSAGLSVEGDTTENSAVILTSTDDERKTIKLADDLGDFKLSYKFENGKGWGTTGVLAPVLVKMRGVYSFANLYYNPNGDMYFSGGGEQARHVVGGGTSGWHSVEIIMSGENMVILYDGIVWDSRTLVKGASSGELSIALRYSDTKIADIKVEAIENGDTEKIVDADFSVNANTNFPVSGTYNSDEKALEITNLWSEYVLDGPNNQDNLNYGSVENYVLELEIRLDGVTTSNYQRGVEIHLPSGNSVGIFGTQVRTAPRTYLTGHSTDKFTYRSIDMLDGSYHTLKVVSKFGTEMIVVDGQVLKTYEITDRASGNISWKNNKNEGTAFLKYIKITDFSDGIERAVYSEPEVLVAQRNASNRVITRTHSTVINQDAWIFSTRFKINDLDAHTERNVVWLRLKTTDSGNTNSVGLCIEKNQYYMQGSGYGVTHITDDNGYVPYNLKSNEWIDVRVAVICNYIIVTLDGTTNVWYAQNGIPQDSATSDHIQFFPNTDDTVSIDENIVFDYAKYEYASELDVIISKIESIGEISVESSSAIFNADSAYRSINAESRNEIKYFAQMLDAAYNSYHALFSDGDVNEDGNVNIIDLIRLKKVVAQAAEKTIKADVDRDDDRAVDASDAVLMRRILLK